MTKLLSKPEPTSIKLVDNPDLDWSLHCVTYPEASSTATFVEWLRKWADLAEHGAVGGAAPRNIRIAAEVIEQLFLEAYDRK